MVILTCTFIFCFYTTYKQEQKFKTQKTGIKIEEFKTIWGKPKSIFTENKDEIVLIYEKNYFLGETYIFKFNSKEMILISKHIDD